MKYNKLVAISGLTGLFEMVTSRGDGAVVKSLEDKSTKFVSNRMHNFSHLETIEVYTTGENMNLADVFNKMKASNESLPGASSDAKAIKAYFEKVVPELDMERVYASDMKKMVKWLDVITGNNIEIELTGESAEDESHTDQSAVKKNSNVAGSKAPTVKSGPARKVNAPRKMA
jgi:hypothetical protein